jgi:hypothetical protein
LIGREDSETGVQDVTIAGRDGYLHIESGWMALEIKDARVDHVVKEIEVIDRASIEGEDIDRFISLLEDSSAFQLEDHQRKELGEIESVDHKFDSITSAVNHSKTFVLYSVILESPEDSVRSGQFSYYHGARIHPEYSDQVRSFLPLIADIWEE